MIATYPSIIIIPNMIGLNIPIKDIDVHISDVGCW